MPELDLRVLFIVLQLIYLEGILSIDNAAVLGAMVSHLPRHEPIPWPRSLRFLQAPVHNLLGGQRPAALKVGLLGAYLGRGLMLFIASWVIQNPWLLLLGGIYLIKLAVDHLGVTPIEARQVAAEAAGQSVRRIERSFWSVVLAVELADLAFSLDNVVAAVALSRELWVVFVGVGLGIVTMRFAAGIFVYLIERYPVLEAAAYLLVLSIGLGLLLEDFLHIRPNEVQRFFVSFSIIVLTILYERVPAVHRIGQRFTWMKRVLGYISVAFIYALKPVAWILETLLRAMVLLVSVRREAEDARLEDAAVTETRELKLDEQQQVAHSPGSAKVPGAPSPDGKHPEEEAAHPAERP